jgi:hypothetical protein
MSCRRKTQQAGTGSAAATVLWKDGVHLPSQGSPDELKEAALALLDWEPRENATYQMNLHPNTPPWYDFRIWVRGTFIALSPIHNNVGFNTASVITHAEWMEKMATGRIRRKA